MPTHWEVPILRLLRTLPGVQGLHPGRKRSRSPESLPDLAGERQDGRPQRTGCFCHSLAPEHSLFHTIARNWGLSQSTNQTSKPLLSANCMQSPGQGTWG